jgi:hypothetical protein
MNLRTFLLLLVLCTVATIANAQDTASAYQRLLNFPENFFSKLQSKITRTESQLQKQTDKYLTRLAKQEKKLKRKLQLTDSVKANELFGDVDERYNKLRADFSKHNGNLKASILPYSGNADSVFTALEFLNQQASAGKTGMQKNIEASLASYRQLQGKFVNANQLKAQLRKRQEYLKQQLQNTPLAKEFKKFQTQVYYYRAQVNEYKKVLSNPAEIGKRLLATAKKIPAFQHFFNKYSQLAAMFGTPDNYGSMASLQGLQTRAGVQSMINQRIVSGGPGAQQLVQQNIAAAQSQLQQLKQKLNRLKSGGDSEMDIPGFKPNNQRTKSFLKRLEFGSNLQTQKSQRYFPATTDIGLSVGYKLNDKSIIGIGASYKLGLGKGWNDIQLTHQGIGIRSFVEWKLKGSFFVSGGFEQNYRAEFSRITELKDQSAWQQSGLLGITKKYRVSKRFKGNMQVMYDFLHAQQVPGTQPVVFRFGYNF